MARAQWFAKSIGCLYLYPRNEVSGMSESVCPCVCTYVTVCSQFVSLFTVCPDDILWNLEPFVTKLALVVHRHEPESDAQKRKKEKGLLS